jgi:hypothetical protein
MTVHVHVGTNLCVCTSDDVVSFVIGMGKNRKCTMRPSIHTIVKNEKIYTTMVCTVLLIFCTLAVLNRKYLGSHTI